MNGRILALAGVGLASVLALVVLAACAEPETAEERAAREVAERALLRLEDFPAGWTEQPQDDDVEIDFATPECESLVEEIENSPGPLADADSPEFHGPNDEEVRSTVTVYGGVAAARKRFTGLTDLWRCKQDIGDAIVKSLEEELGEVDATLNVAELLFPSHGDESSSLRATFRIQVEGESFEFAVDIFALRVGRVVASMIAGNAEGLPDSNEEQRLIGIIEERLNAAAAELD